MKLQRTCYNAAVRHDLLFSSSISSQLCKLIVGEVHCDSLVSEFLQESTGDTAPVLIFTWAGILFDLSIGHLGMGRLLTSHPTLHPYKN